MDDARQELAEAANRAGIGSDELRLVRSTRYESLLVAIVERFTTLGKPGLQSLWWWESFRPPMLSRHIADADRWLRDLLPDEDRVWFIAEDWPRTKRHGNYWLYDAKRSRLPDLLAEMFPFEYYVASKKLDWLFAENHHDVVFAVGNPAIEKLQRFAPPSSAGWSDL